MSEKIGGDQSIDTPSDIVGEAIRTVVNRRGQPKEVADLLAAWYADVLAGNVPLELGSAQAQDRAFQELERLFERMWSPHIEGSADFDTLSDT
jgi:hypothetical protein